MPVKISGVTSSKSGEILPGDVIKMKQKYIDGVNLCPIDGGKAIVKKMSVAVRKEEVQALIAYYEAHDGIDVVQMSFAVHLDSFLTCEGKDDSNSLTVVMEAASFMDPDDPLKGLSPHNGENDFVVIPGYHGFPAGNNANGASGLNLRPDIMNLFNNLSVDGSKCCPSSTP